MIRDHGVFAGNAKCRAKVVPGPEPETHEQLVLVDEEQGGPPQPTRPSRHPWAWLLARVFRVDITECAQCDGRLSVVAVVKAGADREHLARARRARPAAAALRSARARLRALNDAVGVELRPR